jgi:two-component system LytT family response regulator
VFYLPNYCPHRAAVRAGRGQAVPVALDSGSQENAIEPFEANAVDYIHKPFGSDRVERSVARAKARLAGSRDENYATRLEALSAVQRLQHYQERIVVPVNGRILLVDTKRH